MSRLFFILLIISIVVSSCIERPILEEQIELSNDEMSQLNVMAGHDLRSASFYVTQINLSSEFTADSYPLIIKKKENNQEILLYEGYITKKSGISVPLKLGPHTNDLVIYLGSENQRITKVINKNNLNDVLIEPDVQSSDGSSNSDTSQASSPPPSSDCSLYSEFSGNDNGSFKISGNSSLGITANNNTTIYICSGASWTPAYINGSQNKLNVYISSGGTLNLSSSSTEIKIYNEGNLQASSNLNLGPLGLIENWGSVSVSGIATINGTIRNYAGTFTSNNFTVNGGGKVYNDGETNGGAQFTVNNNLQVNQLFHNKANSTLTVGGQLTVNGSAEFYNYCKTTIGTKVQNDGKIHLYGGSYTSLGTKWTNNGSATHKLYNGAYLSSSQISSNISIVGNGTYSVVQTGSISFNWGNKFKGPLDICSGSYTSAMGNNAVISTCTTVIPATTCSIGINSITDEDGDCIPADQDVDDNNPNVASYNYPQGEGSFFTAAYEDLWPCEGDFDFNDVVHNYSYREGWDSGLECDVATSQLKELTFSYKFPALGAWYNNSLALRVIDSNDDASLTLDASAYYSDAKITRLHDDENETTSFIFTDLKSIYGASASKIINSKQRDYSSIPTLTGTITGIDGGYDEYILLDGESGNELHHTTDSSQQSYAALNNPTKYNNDRFGQCNDQSGGSNNYVNANGLPWAITDIPVEWEWPKEGIQLTEAYPDFSTFATSNPDLDWYSESSNKVASKIFQD